MIELREADCRGVLPTLDRRAIALVLTDPPYGIPLRTSYGAQQRGRKARARNYPPLIGAGVPFDPAPILALDVPTILWGANHYADRLPPAAGWLVWDKRIPLRNDAASCELAWTNCVKVARLFRHLWNGMLRASEKQEHYHPTQKPVALMRWCLRLPGVPTTGFVLDPYAGAAPVGVVCAQDSRDYLGLELEPQYVAIGRQRIAEAQAQLRLAERG